MLNAESFRTIHAPTAHLFTPEKSRNQVKPLPRQFQMPTPKNADKVLALIKEHGPVDRQTLLKLSSFASDLVSRSCTVLIFNGQISKRRVTTTAGNKALFEFISSHPTRNKTQ